MPEVPAAPLGPREPRGLVLLEKNYYHRIHQPYCLLAKVLMGLDAMIDQFILW